MTQLKTPEYLIDSQAFHLLTYAEREGSKLLSVFRSSVRFQHFDFFAAHLTLWRKIFRFLDPAETRSSIGFRVSLSNNGWLRSVTPRVIQMQSEDTRKQSLFPIFQQKYFPTSKKQQQIFDEELFDFEVFRRIY